MYAYGCEPSNADHAVWVVVASVRISQQNVSHANDNVNQLFGPPPKRGGSNRAVSVTRASERLSACVEYTARLTIFMYTYVHTIIDSGTHNICVASPLRVDHCE